MNPEERDIFWDMFILVEYLADEIDIPYMKEPLKKKVKILKEKLISLENL